MMVSRRRFGVGALNLIPFLFKYYQVFDNIRFDSNSKEYNKPEFLRACPEVFGAKSISAEDYRRSNSFDDTKAVQSAIDSGAKELFFQGSYVVSSLNISRPIKLIGGTFIKARGSTGKVLSIRSANVILKDIQIISMNALLLGRIINGILFVIEKISGEIWIDQINGGPMIEGEGIVPGTKIVSEQKMGGVNVYKLNITQNIDLQFIRYTDAKLFNHENDCIHIEGDDVEISGVKILGSAGGGITSLGAKNLKLNKFYIRNVSDNGILVSCNSSNISSDNNIITNGFVEGTGRQNGIFITASAGSVATNSEIRGVKLFNVKVSNCADTALEVGIHVFDANINKCVLGPSFNPTLLCRDASRFMIKNVKIIQSPAFPQSDLWSAVAVVKQTESDAWQCNGIFDRIQFRGFANRGFIYINQSKVTVRRCSAINYLEKMRQSSDQKTYFAIIGDEISDLQFDNLFVKGWTFGFLLNYSSQPVELGQIIVQNSAFKDVIYLIDAGKAHCNSFFLKGCKLIGLNRVMYKPSTTNLIEESNEYVEYL